MNGVGQEETEPSALSSGEGPHFSSLSTLSPMGRGHPFRPTQAPLRHISFVPIPRPQGSSLFYSVPQVQDQIY